MTDLVELGGHRLAIEIASMDRTEAVDGGLLLPSARVAILHGLGDALFYRHGQNSWSPCGWRRLSDSPLRIADPKRRLTADDTKWDDASRHHSSAVAALQGPDGAVLLLGALGLDTPRLAADRDTLSAWYEMNGDGWFLAYGSEDEVFAAYASQLSQRLGSRKQRAGNIWCSWYAYYEQISETQLAGDIASLRGLPFEILQVDDGWEKMVGDWQPNRQFPSGMHALADRITEAGLLPGLWIAPFVVLPDSELATQYPRLLLRNESGQPAIAGFNWGSAYYALDLSRDDARAHVAETIHRVVHEWGFRYLKLDFINAAMAPGVRPDGIGRERVYREALALIREVAGDDVYLLGSGAVLLPSLGLLDGLRSGPDVAPFWGNYGTHDPSDAMARNAVVNTIHRLWQSRLAQVDPDVVYFRTRHNLLNDEEMSWLRDLADVCSFRAVSDPPRWLSPDELEAMIGYLTRSPHIERQSRYQFTIDGRRVDFAPAVNGARDAQSGLGQWGWR
jgi:alpha-galactosidase